MDRQPSTVFFPPPAYPEDAAPPLRLVVFKAPHFPRNWGLIQGATPGEKQWPSFSCAPTLASHRLPF
jgi:hypothetical protein